MHPELTFRAFEPFVTNMSPELVGHSHVGHISPPDLGSHVLGSGSGVLVLVCICTDVQEASVTERKHSPSRGVDLDEQRRSPNE